MHLDNSRKWMEYLENHFDECVDYFKFAMVWMSFNSYYAFHFRNVEGEKNAVLAFAEENKGIYNDLLNTGEFSEVLNDFKKTGWLFGEPGERDCVADARGFNKKTYFKEGEELCVDFFKVLYQIRCNFFHGHKEISDPGNKELIQWAYRYLNIFWKEFLKKNS